MMEVIVIDLVFRLLRQFNNTLPSCSTKDHNSAFFEAARGDVRQELVDLYLVAHQPSLAVRGGNVS
jgi:hypothetical protein